MKFLCPACGAEVIFKTQTAAFGVCTYCNSMLVRQDLNLESIGKMATLPQDMSPLQIGTTGVYGNGHFEIIGKQRLKWDEGSWNEWYLLFANGRDGWLGEAQGMYMMSFQINSAELPSLSSLHPEKTVHIQNEVFTVRDLKQVVCSGSAGELPTKSYKGRTSTSVDLGGAGLKFANIDYGEDETRLYVGQYVEFEELQLANLRKIDGWS